MSFRVKLILLCGLIASFSVGVGLLGRRALTQVVEISRPVGQEILPKTLAVAQIRAEFRELRIQLRSLAIPGTTAQQIDDIEKNAKTAIAKIEEALKDFKGLPVDPDEQKMCQETEEALHAFLTGGKDIFAWARSSNSADTNKMNAFFINTCPGLADQVYKKVLALTAHEDGLAKATVKNAEQIAAENIRITLITVCVGFLLAIGLGALGANYLSNSLMGIVKIAADKIVHGAHEVARMAAELKASSVAVTENTNRQAEAVQETSASAHEIRSMVEQTEKSSEISMVSSTETTQVANQAQASVNAMKNAMGEIETSNAEIAGAVQQSVKELDDVVKIISDISTRTKVINEIVFQTKLLSFNASVEAARAGEHGKGFAVVAEEVGNLAQMSGTASQEINALLDQSVKRVQTMAKTIEQNVGTIIAQGQSRITEGVRQSHECSVILNQIVEKSNKTLEMMREIAQAAREQNKGVAEISQAIESLDSTTNDNASQTTQVSQSARSLADESARLQEASQELLVSIGSSSKKDTGYSERSPKSRSPIKQAA